VPVRFRGVHHVELSVLDYAASVAFFDEMFGWLGYKSFWTLDLGYRSTYYMARFPFPHSYIGIQPARAGAKLSHAERATGVHHVALWARNRREVDEFHRGFLLPHEVPVSDAPAEYPLYTPGYYAVFFDDPITGIHFELAHTPYIPSLGSLRRWRTALKEARKAHPEWRAEAWKEAMRRLPPRRGRLDR
jgi:catechol 2,3-dioxygenase-like lactoylglutathione lyase family enzyme